jgi:hypothetical protein
VLAAWRDALEILSVALAILAAVIYIAQTLRGAVGSHPMSFHQRQIGEPRQANGRQRRIGRPLMAIDKQIRRSERTAGKAKRRNSQNESFISSWLV